MARNSFNVSLQKKHNRIVLSPLIEKCETEGGVISDVIVDYVEKALDYEKRMGLNKVMQTYKIIQSMVGAQYPADTPQHAEAVENVLKRVIRIDGEELSNFLSDPTGYVGMESSTPLQQLAPLPASKPTQSFEQPSTKEEIRYPATEETASSMDVSSVDEEEERIERARRQRAEARRRKQEEEERKQQTPETNSNENDEIDESSLNVGALFNM